MDEKEKASLAQRIHDVVSRGGRVAVVGWRVKNHDEVTENISTEKMLFIGNKAPPNDVSFILMTKAINRRVQGRISEGGKSVHLERLDPEDVRDLCRRNERVLLEAVRRPEPATGIVGEAALVISSQPQPSRERATPTASQTREKTSMEQFIAAFLAEASRGGGFVGKKVLAKLIREHGINKAPVLVAEGWIVPHLGEGKTRVGTYIAGEKMKAHSITGELMSSDPLVRARNLVAQKERFLKEKGELTVRIKEVESELAKIEKLEVALKSVTDILE